MKMVDVQARLESAGVHPNTLSVRKGVYTAKRSYYFGIFSDGTGLKDAVLKAFPKAAIVDFGNHYHEFIGAAKAGGPKDSYHWVKFKLPQEE